MNTQVAQSYQVGQLAKLSSGEEIFIMKAELKNEGVVYNDKYNEASFLKKTTGSFVTENRLFAYERVRDGKVEWYTREFGGNQYVKRNYDWDQSRNQGRIL